MRNAVRRGPLPCCCCGAGDACGDGGGCGVCGSCGDGARVAVAGVPPMCSGSGDGGRGAGTSWGGAASVAVGTVGTVGTGTGARLLRTSVRESCAESCAMALLKRSGLTLKRIEPARRNESQMVRGVVGSGTGGGGSSGGGERRAAAAVVVAVVVVAAASLPKSDGDVRGGSTGTPGGAATAAGTGMLLCVCACVAGQGCGRQVWLWRSRRLMEEGCESEGGASVSGVAGGGWCDKGGLSISEREKREKKMRERKKKIHKKNRNTEGTERSQMEQEMCQSAINKYTEAMKLVKECSDKIKNAEELVSKIALENGSLEDFGVDA